MTAIREREEMEKEVDIERIYEEMIIYYRQQEKQSDTVTKRHSTPVRNYAATTRTPRTIPTTDRPRRTMSGSIAQFTAMYEK